MSTGNTLRLLLGTSALLLTFGAQRALPENLSSIVASYGGSTGISRLQTFSAKGQECVVLPNHALIAQEEGCANFTQFRRPPMHWRDDVGSDGGAIVDIYSGDRGETYFDGTWIQRLRGKLTRMPEGSHSIEDVKRFWQYDSLSFPGFLAILQTPDVRSEGRISDLEGKETEAYSVNLPNASTVRFYFDLETGLCVERSVIRAPGNANHVLFDDYRRVDGLPIPFRRRYFYNKTLTSEQTFAIISLNDVDLSFFDVQRKPSVWALMAVLVAVSLAFLTLVFVGIRTKLRRSVVEPLESHRIQRNP
jgi:hypothetical protein